jgi:hypothetical protein
MDGAHHRARRQARGVQRRSPFPPPPEVRRTPRQTGQHLDLGSCALCPAVQGQLGQARQWEAEGLSLNQRVTSQRRGEQAGFPELEPCPASRCREGGNGAAWTHGGLRTSFTRNLWARQPGGLQRLWEELSRSLRPRLTHGAPCVGHSVCSGSPLVRIQEDPFPPPTHKHSRVGTPGGGGQKPDRQGRGHLGAGKSPKARSGDGHEQESRPSCGLRSWVGGCGQSQLTPHSTGRFPVLCVLGLTGAAALRLAPS